MFGYIDTVTTISKCQAPLIDLEELAQEDNDSDRSTTASSPGTTSYTSHNEALFGVALPLFTIIGKISGLANRRKERIDEISEICFRESAKRIEVSLREWEPDQIYDSDSSSLGDRRNSKDLLNAAHAIRWASILRLHQVVEGYNRKNLCVVECTTHILELIARIRFGSPAEGILTFPLVMAASGCSDDEQRFMVRERWMVMERTIGFENVYQAKEMVEAVWRAVDQGAKDQSCNNGLSVNWAQIRYFDFPGVVLL